VVDISRARQRREIAVGPDSVELKGAAMNATPSKANRNVNCVLGLAAVVLLLLTSSPRDSLIDRVTRGDRYEFVWSLALITVIGVGIVASYRFFAWRVFWFIVLVALASGSFHNVRMQSLLLWALLIGFALTYRRFLGKLSIYMIGHPSQSLILALFFCLVYGVIGTSYGVPNLFWAETFRARFFSAFGATLLLAVLGVNAFFLDDMYHTNWQLVEDFMERWHIDFHLRAEKLKLGFLFGDPGLEPDPNKIIKEPRYGAMISQVLRTGRLPMLTLMSLPAVFPLMFPNVPRYALRNVPWILAFLDVGKSTAVADVGRDFRAWLLGIICWGSGILAGIFLVKALIRGGMWLEKAYEARHEKWGEWVANFENTLWKWLVSPLAIVVYITIAVAAFGETLAVDLGWRFYADGSLGHWLHIGLVLSTLCIAAVWSAHRASVLRPSRWPPFCRFLLLCAATYGVIAVADTLLRNDWPDLDLAISPGMGVCMLLMVLSLVGSWVALLRPVRDGGAPWIEKLNGLAQTANAAGKEMHARRIQERIQLHEQIAPKNFRSDLLTLLIIALWIAVMNADDFKLRFDPLRYDLTPLPNWKYAVEKYGTWAVSFVAPAPVELTAEPDLNDDTKTLEAWRDRLWTETPEGQKAKEKKTPECFRPKLVVVCATGGASRAAYWTARVLHRLGADIRRSDDGLPGFHESVRLVTGASGGMVGAAHYLARRKVVLDQFDHGTLPVGDDKWVDDDGWVTSMPTENLSAVASHIALVGLAQALVPRLPHPLDYDRGQVLDMEWPLLGMAFSAYRDDEKRGALPSLVFTPVTVDDGRRLLISNLALHPLVVNRGNEVDHDGYGAGTYSIAAPEFYRVFGKNADGLSLATAARMSATFPMVSPAVNLPTDPPIRVVDAGYYDNYGVNIAVAWLFRNRDWLVKNTSGIALVQIRAFMGRRERLGTPEPSEESIMNGLQFFSTPFQAFAGMRDSMPMFRNDEEIAALGEVLSRQSGRRDFFTTVIFENSAQVLLDSTAAADLWPMKDADRRADDAPFVTDVAMTWYLSEVEKRSMDVVIPRDEIAKHWKLVAARLEEVDQENNEDVACSLFRRPADRLRWLIQASESFSRLIRTGEFTRVAFGRKEFERALNYERIQALRTWWIKSK
jgi:hypothetical protein